MQNFSPKVLAAHIAYAVFLLFVMIAQFQDVGMYDRNMVFYGRHLCFIMQGAVVSSIIGLCALWMGVSLHLSRSLRQCIQRIVDWVAIVSLCILLLTLAVTESIANRGVTFFREQPSLFLLSILIAVVGGISIKAILEWLERKRWRSGQTRTKRFGKEVVGDKGSENGTRVGDGKGDKSNY